MPLQPVVQGLQRRLWVIGVSVLPACGAQDGPQRQSPDAAPPQGAEYTVGGAGHSGKAGAPSESTGSHAADGSRQAEDSRDADGVTTVSVSSPERPALDTLSQLPRGETTTCAFGDGTVELAEYVERVLLADGDTVYYTTDLGLMRQTPGGEREIVHRSGTLTDCARLPTAELACASRRFWSIPLDGGEASFVARNSGGVIADPQHVYTFDVLLGNMMRRRHGADEWTVFSDVGDVPGFLPQGVSSDVLASTFDYAGNGEQLFMAARSWAAPGEILVIERDGTTRTLGETHTLLGLAADLTHVYWSNERTLGIEHIDIEGRAQETLSDVKLYPQSVAVDADHVYWTGHVLEGSDYTGGVLRSSKAGGPAELLIEPRGGLSVDLQLGETCVFWLNNWKLTASGK